MAKNLYLTKINLLEGKISKFIFELDAIDSLLEIGNILFKDARNETPAELEAMRSYFKSKYKKV